MTFKPIPHRFYGESTDAIEPNVLVIKIEPDEGISMRFEAKVPGPKESRPQRVSWTSTTAPASAFNRRLHTNG